MKIYFASRAEEDFSALVAYIAERNPTAAAELGNRIFDVIDKLARREFQGPEQTLLSGEIVRSWPVPPVRIYYQQQPHAFWVLRIYHQAQKPITR